MKKLVLCLSALLSGAACLWAQAPELKIYSGDNDTVYTASQVIVAVTTPGASVTFQGQPAKVYNTGSTGAEVQLNPGNNTVEISSSLNGHTTTRQVNIFRAEEPARAPKAPAPPAETVYETPVTVRTTQGAYLQYGNGGDRLGGSKMGFLVPDIPLKAVGTSGDLYKIQLSQQRYAYLPMEYAVKSDEYVPTAVNTGSWSVTNTGRTDRVSVSLPTRRAYHYFTEIDPSTIVVEIYGATDNSNWITQRSLQLGIIDYVTFRQTESDVYQVIIHLKEKYQWGFAVKYEGNSLVIDVRHRPQSLQLKDLTIGLDAGHGGEYLGAVSPSGIKEKDVNLDIVLRLRDMLEKRGARVVLTRDSDTGPTMAQRKLTWLEGGVDLAISVHNNSGGSALSSPGTSTYYKHLFDRPLAQALLERLLETGLNCYGLTGNFNFSLNGPTEYPNALVEGMFMSSLEEEELLADPAFRQLLAEKIFLGLQDYLKQAGAK